MNKANILIIDDEIDIVETTAAILRSRGYDVTTAIDGIEGLERVRNSKPSLILLDIMMPGMDGYELCNRLKTDKATKNIPIIMFTAKGEELSITKAEKSGANDYIVKPFVLSVLLTKIRNHLPNIKEG